MGAAWFLFELKAPVFWVESRKSREPYVPLIRLGTTVRTRGAGGGGGDSIVFHLSFLTRSACQV